MEVLHGHGSVDDGLYWCHNIVPFNAFQCMDVAEVGRSVRVVKSGTRGGVECFEAVQVAEVGLWRGKAVTHVVVTVVHEGIFKA